MSKKPKKFYKKAKVTIKKEEIKVVNQQSPKNNRSISEQVSLPASKQPESRLKPSFKVFFAFMAILGIFAFIGSKIELDQVSKQYMLFKNTDENRKNLEAKLSQWEETAVEHPGSRDIYLQLANIEYQLNNKTSAQYFVNRALLLDPNYPYSVEMKSKIE